jgi:hypothetical protein
MGCVAKVIRGIECICGNVFDACVKASEDWKCPCPSCRAECNPARQAGNKRFYGNRRFAGAESVSLVEGFCDFEVPEARKLLPGFQHCIQDNGDVHFTSRSEQRGYTRAVEQLRRASAAGESR